MSDAVKDGRLTERERFDLHVLTGVAYRSKECPDAVAAARATLVRLGLIHAFDIDDVRCGPSCHICRERDEGAAPAALERAGWRYPRSYGCRCHQEPAPPVRLGSDVRHWPSCPNHPINARHG